MAYVTVPSGEHQCVRILEAPSSRRGLSSFLGVDMELHELYPGDLVFEHEATAATGVPGTVIRQWARRGRIRKFAGNPAEYAGNGREFKTMYALPEIEERAKTYRPMPQRAPKAA